MAEWISTVTVRSTLRGLFFLFSALTLSSCGDGVTPAPPLKDGIYLSARPTQAPDDGRILFSAVRHGVSTIYTMNFDGSDVLPVPIPAVNLHSPVSSADGEWIAFVAEGGLDGRGSIAVSRLDGTEFRVYPRAAGRLNRYPSFHPAGNVLVFQRSESVPTAQEFWSLDLRSGTERLLRDDDAWNPTPQVFLPDGEKILFAQMEKIDWGGKISFRNQIYTLEVATGTLSRVGQPGRSSLCISPDGEEMFFVESDGTENAVFRARRDGSEPRKLYGSMLLLEGMQVSRDGRVILFLQQVEAYSSLYDIMLLHLVTGDIKRILPDWEGKKNP